MTDSYAVSVNDTLYFVGQDSETGMPYTSTSDGDDYTDYSTVDGDIELIENGVFFTINEEPYRIHFLDIRLFNDN
jgi:hypothetical protein